MTEKVSCGDGGGGRVEVIKGKGCSRLFLEFSSSFRGTQSFSLEPMSPASTVSVISEHPVKSHGPLSGLVICVTGLSKETRKQVKEATERLGGQYSPHPHARCTHLVVQIVFADINLSMLSNMDQQMVCSWFQSAGLWIASRGMVAEALSVDGATLSQWFVGCNASHVICEGASVLKYLGHLSCLVTPQWILKSAKEKCKQRLVHLSFDLARYTGVMLNAFHDSVSKEMTPSKRPHERSLSEVNVRRKWRKSAALGSDHAPSRGSSARHIIRFLFPASKVGAVIGKGGCNIAQIRQETGAMVHVEEIVPGCDERVFVKDKDKNNEVVSEQVKADGQETKITESCDNPDGEQTEIPDSGDNPDEHGETDEDKLSFPLIRSKFNNINRLFPLYSQERMSAEEIELAIHTDSRHVDRLRSAYSGSLEFKRIDFGSQKRFEMLKRVSDDNYNVYELLIRA